MKALVIRQPWADLIAKGQKTIETRTWPTKIQEEFLIVAGRLIDLEGCYYLGLDAPYLYETGKAIAIARVYKCAKMTKEDEAGAMCPFGVNLYSWHLGNVRRLTPFPVVGHQRFFNVALADTPAIKSFGDSDGHP